MGEADQFENLELEQPAPSGQPRQPRDASRPVGMKNKAAPAIPVSTMD